MNISPLTDLIVAKALGGDLDAAFSSFDATRGQTILTGLAAAKSWVETEVKGLTGAGYFQVDPLAGTFAVGDSNDQILDQLASAMKKSAQSHANWRQAAMTSTSLSENEQPCKSGGKVLIKKEPGTLRMVFTVCQATTVRAATDSDPEFTETRVTNGVLIFSDVVIASRKDAVKVTLNLAAHVTNSTRSDVQISQSGSFVTADDDNGYIIRKMNVTARFQAVTVRNPTLMTPCSLPSIQCGCQSENRAIEFQRHDPLQRFVQHGLGIARWSIPRGCGHTFERRPIHGGIPHHRGQWLESHHPRRSEWLVHRHQ